MTKENRGWPTYILGGRLRTSTVALIVAFLLVWWIYEVNQPEPRAAGTRDPGGTAGFRARPELHLGAAHPGAAAHDDRPHHYDSAHDDSDGDDVADVADVADRPRHHQRLADHDNARAPGSSADVAVA